MQHKAAVRKVITRAEASGAARRPTPQNQLETSRGGVDAAWQQLQSAPVGFEIDSVPSADLELATVMVRTGDAAGASFLVGKVDGHRIFVGGSAAMMAGGTGSDALKRINPGDEAQIDNSNFLAVQYYHRHQVPTPDSYVWDQFRASDGRPLYPQRPKLIGPEFAASAGGTLQSGRFEGKMIVIESLWDQDAFPWQADWYASKVKAALGSRFDENFRLWFIDHALHGDVEKQFDPTHTVSYVGALQQALRDLSAWVEKGVTPPASTTYRIVDGQVQVPPTAAERRGIQPVVALKADGSARAEVAVGQPVTLSAVIDTPADAGRVVAAEWDMEGTGDFSPAEFSRSGVAAGRPRVEAKHTYSTPATYFTVLRVTSQRQGDLKSPYAQIHNLARVRVVVR